MGKKGRPGASRPRSLLSSVQLLLLLSFTTITLVVGTASLAMISAAQVAELRRRAVVTADEARVLLEEPLYNVDESQAVRIGEALLSSGRISGIELASTATGKLLSTGSIGTRSRIPPQSREVFRGAIPLGSFTLFFSDAEAAANRRRLAAVTLALVAAMVCSSLLSNRFIVRRKIREPMDSILDGIRAVASGEYGRPVPATPYDDVNLFVDQFNDMSREVLTKSSELKEANTLLEIRVAERTRQLEASLEELRKAQYQLVEAEKLSALGQLSAGMAHELNTPLGSIIASDRLLCEFFDEKHRRQLAFLRTLSPAQAGLFDAALELGTRRSARLEARPADLGRRKAARAALDEAGIPKAEQVAEQLVELGIDDSLPQLAEALRDLRNVEILSFAAEPVIARRMAEVIAVASAKAASVVAALRSYMNPATPGEDGTVDVVADLERVLALMEDMLRHGIRVRRDFSEARAIGSSDKLGQVWMNLIRNAAQAMDFKGELVLRALTRDGKVLVSVEDTGPGIPAEIRERVFEPFFTTKRHGEGIGLGLEICKRVVLAHGGSIGFESRPGRTAFTVTLPARPKR